MRKIVFPEWIQEIAAAVAEPLILPQVFVHVEEQEFCVAYDKQYLPHHRAID